jgi:hypothetical protein
MGNKSDKKAKSSLSNKKINKLQKEIVELLKEKRSIKFQLEEILQEYLTLMPNDKEDLKDWYTELSLDSLYDLCNYENGKQFISNLEKLELKGKLREDREEAVEQIEKIKSQITINNIDVLLEKIRLLEKGLDK